MYERVYRLRWKKSLRNRYDVGTKCSNDFVKPVHIRNVKKSLRYRKQSRNNFGKKKLYVIFIIRLYFVISAAFALNIECTPWPGIEPGTIGLQSEWLNNCATETERDRVHFLA